MNDEIVEKENSGKVALPADNGEESKPQDKGPEWEADLDSYPLREPADDPRWAVRTVRIWAGFVLLSLAFILTLLVLGAIYD